MENKKFEVTMIGSEGQEYYATLNSKEDVEELTDFVFDETNCEVSVRPIEKEEEASFPRNIPVAKWCDEDGKEHTIALYSIVDLSIFAELWGNKIATKGDELGLAELSPKEVGELHKAFLGE